MNPNEQSQQPSQPAAGPTTQPQPAPVNTQPVPATPVAPAQPAAPLAAAAEPQKSITIVFEDDLQFVITAEKINDMRFMDLYAEVSEDQLKISKMIKWLIGPERYESIYTYYEAKGQQFTITKFFEVFEKLDKDLNSQPDFLSK